MSRFVPNDYAITVLRDVFCDGTNGDSYSVAAARFGSDRGHSVQMSHTNGGKRAFMHMSASMARDMAAELLASADAIDADLAKPRARDGVVRAKARREGAA